MSNLLEGYTRGELGPISLKDAVSHSEALTAKVREVRERAQCGLMQARAALEIAGWDVERAVENLKVVSALPPRTFTWDDARDIATFVRDGLLMIVKGLERKFDLGKK